MTDSLPILAAVLAACTVAIVIGIVLWRARHGADPHAAVLTELSRAHSDAAARLEAMIRMLGDRQSQLQHAVNERLDSVSSRLGDSLEKTKQSTTENLQKLNERLAVIDSAQKNITDLATQVSSLHSVLANKQSRGAFGQGRMEIIVRDGLPKDCYAFQHTLTNNTRPDCVVFPSFIELLPAGRLPKPRYSVNCINGRFREMH